MTKITKAVIAAAGLGTRFLPQTKAMPKEMLPIVDRPVIQILVEQIVAAGVEDVIIVTGAQKRALEDHFDRAYGLEQELISKGKSDKAEEIKRIANLANFIYVRQKGSYGTARPLLNARPLIKDQPFFYFYADDFFSGDVSAPAQMIEAYNQTNNSIVALHEVEDKHTDKYGIATPGEKISSTVIEVKEIVEKPGPENAKSNLASVHGYLLTPEIFDEIDENLVSDRGEVEIQPALNNLANRGMLSGRQIDGDYYDTGNTETYLQAVVDAALNDDKLGGQFRDYLSKRLEKVD